MGCLLSLARAPTKGLCAYVGEDAAGGDRHAAEELVELLVVADGKLHVAGDDARLLVVAGGVPGELEDLGRQVLEHRRQVDGGAGAHAAREPACTVDEVVWCTVYIA